MAKRKRIALSYRLGYNFSAGVVIYIQNIIRGLNLLDDHLKPHIIVIHSEQSPLADIKEINYPYIEYYLFKPLKRNFFKLAVNKITKTFLKTYLIKRYSFPKNIDLLYPYFECEETFFNGRIRISRQRMIEHANLKSPVIYRTFFIAIFSQEYKSNLLHLLDFVFFARASI